MLSFTSLTFTLFFLTNFIYAASNCLTVTQTKSNSWSSGSQKFSQWQVKLENTGSSALKDVSFSMSPAPSDFYEVVKQSTGMFTLPAWIAQNGGLQAHATHNFGYTIQSDVAATITVNCPGSSSSSPSTVAPTSTPKPTQKPTSTPIPTTTPKATPRPTTTPSPSPKPTIAPKPTISPSAQPTTPTNPPPSSPSIPSSPSKAPTSPPSSSTSSPSSRCNIVLIIDNYVMRKTSLSVDQVKAKYTDYFSDIQSFYKNNFNMELTISHIYTETSGSFSDSFNDGELLDSFRSALVGGFFPGVPSSACVYHLITGRDLVGVGGLTWVGTACGANTFNLGFTVDQDGSEDALSVIRRMTHEIGHSFGGQHSDYYAADSLFTCDSAVNNGDYRILRSSSYKYLANEFFMTQCATNTIRNSLPSFSCMWNDETASSPIPAYLTIYTEPNYAGDSKVIPARNGIKSCYNIAYPFSGTLSGFQVADAGVTAQRVAGVRFFAHGDCVGASNDFSLSSANVGAALDNTFNSYMFILA